ncbi:retrovirus-related Pol polyprotein from transposon 297 [Nephila pilipes]|uniref:Retrovirus-related Pol polyprotein from transposon 297 n=1 Tax=Nephila pilipes TaxID=299642 RepID=A0A8X6QPY9_NEPPI|nr:retrovirus-related Pol polyprotein from transposon 297 [Nephila pilipes]
MKINIFTILNKLRLEEYGLVLNASKIVRGETSVKFLVHIVTTEGIFPIPEKVAAITNFPKLENVKELRSFLATYNFYRRFTPHPARTQAVLNSYLKEIKRKDRTPILIRASLKVAERYVWLSIRQDVTLFARTYLQCQRAKLSRHARSEIGKFETPRFEHAYIDLVGPLPPSEVFRYSLSCVDRPSKWPEAFPLVDITAEAVVRVFYTGWISRFGPPLRLTTDQGTQF